MKWKQKTYRAGKKELNNIIFLDPVDKKELAKIERCDLGMQLLAGATFNMYYKQIFDYLSAGLHY